MSTHANTPEGDDIDSTGGGADPLAGDPDWDGPTPPVFAIATAVYGSDAGGRIITLRRGSKSAMAGMYYLPGGIMDEGEEPYGAAAREFTEETGLRIGPLRVVGACPIWLYGQDYMQLSFAGQVEAGGEVTLSHEHDDYRWVSPAEFAAEFSPDRVAAIAGDDPRVRRLLDSLGEDARRYAEGV
ncbi:MAG TPA: NUDIX domain-containing protein [Acidimicrobiales bacterium]|nr:NUDIX domain-containing protein [Acidimicrobiales bacterium]